jgi:hypothetical protein
MLRQPRPSVFNGVPFTFPFAGQSYARRILNTQSAALIADWQFGEISGTSAVNAEGTSARDGSYVNGVTLNAATFTDGTPAPSFDGTNDCVNVYTSSLASATNFNEGTFAVWMNPDATFLASATGGYLTLMTDSSAANGIQIFKSASANSFFFRRTVASVNKTITRTISTAVWHHLALTWSAANNQLIAYVDGSSVGSDVAGSISAALGSSRAAVGASASTGSTPWKGNLKYATLWTTPLSAGEIAALATV